MKEELEFRIVRKYFHLLSQPNNGKDNGAVYVVKLTKDDPNFEQIRLIDKQLRIDNNESFFLYSCINRKYTKRELESAKLLQMRIKATFEPAGEECGTIYDETLACEICGVNRKQISILKLNNASIPKKDIARTIAGEIIVSERFKNIIEQRGLKGFQFQSVEIGKGNSSFFQLISRSEVDLSERTVAGVDIFDLSISSGSEIYKCPKGHTIGLNLLSEAYVLDSTEILKNDFLASKQRIGVNRGLLRPEPIYFCSQSFRKMVLAEKLTGFEFEVAHID